MLGSISAGTLHRYSAVKLFSKYFIPCDQTDGQTDGPTDRRHTVA